MSDENKSRQSGYGAEGAVSMDPGGHTQSDDINVAMVAVVVAFSAAVLAVSIVALEAWFYNSSGAERERKLVAQYDPHTPLGAMVIRQTDELHTNGWNDRPGMGTETNKLRRVDIDRAMDLVVQERAKRK